MQPDLPFLIVHGPLFWKLVLVGLVVVVFAVVWSVRRRRAIAATRERTRRVERGDGVLVGILHGEARTLEIARRDPFTLDPSTCTASWQEGELWIESTTHGRVAVAGSIRVVAGTRAAFSRGRFPELSETDHVQVRLQVPSGPVTAATLRTLATGDRVVARGQLQASAPRAESDYRSAETAWTLCGDPIELAACTPRAPRIPLAWPSVLMIAVATAGIGWFVENALGQDWVNGCKEAQQTWVGTEPLDISGTHSCVLASSMASTRERGLSSFYSLLERHPYRDEATVQRLDAISRLTEPCDERMRRMMRELRYDAALDEARACFHRRGEHDALVALGRFDEAVNVHVEASSGAPALPTVSTLIAAGRWLQAAERIEHLTGDTHDESEHATRLVCFSHLLRHRGGQKDSARHLETLADQKHGAGCVPMLAAISPDRTRRVQVLETIETRTTLIEQLLYADGIGDLTLRGPERVLARPESTTNAALIWLVATTGIDHPYPDRLRWLAASHVLDGDNEAAMKTASRAVALAEPDPEFGPRDVAYLPALVAFYSPAITPVDVPEADGRAFGRIQIRAGVPFVGRDFGPYHDLAAPAFIAAQRGDGFPLAQYLAGDRRAGNFWSDGDLIAVLPRVTQHRAELVSQLRWRAPDAFGGSLDPQPVTLALRAFLRRELFEAAGLTADAAHWAAIYKRLDRVLRDRDRLVAMMIWAGFSEASR